MKQIWIIALLLAGCAQLPPATGFRDLTVPISSAALLDWERMAGSWVEVARYDAPLQRGCGRGVWRFAGEAVTLDCPRGGEVVRSVAPARIIGPGRLRATVEGAPLELWVLWVDTAYRTLVLGTPDGTMGWILDRSVASSPDRIKAARDMLDFNGYDLQALNERF